jgi:hypothetical protein
MQLDYSTFFTAADPEDVPPRSSMPLVGLWRFVSRVETSRGLCQGRLSSRASSAQAHGLDSTLARAVDAEAGPRQYLQPF